MSVLSPGNACTAVCHHISSSAGYTDRKPCLFDAVLEPQLCETPQSVVRLLNLAVARAVLRKHTVAVAFAELDERPRSESTVVAVDAAAGMRLLHWRVAAVVGIRPRMVTAA